MESFSCLMANSQTLEFSKRCVVQTLPSLPLKKPSSKYRKTSLEYTEKNQYTVFTGNNDRKYSYTIENPSIKSLFFFEDYIYFIILLLSKFEGLNRRGKNCRTRKYVSIINMARS